VLRTHPGGTRDIDAGPRLAPTLVGPPARVRPVPCRVRHGSRSRVISMVGGPPGTGDLCAVEVAGPAGVRDGPESPRLRRLAPHARPMDPLPVPLPRGHVRLGVAGDRSRDLGRGVDGRSAATDPSFLRSPP